MADARYTEEFRNLARLASEVGKTNWDHDGKGVVHDGPSAIATCREYSRLYPTDLARAEFIAAASPAAIMRLLQAAGFPEHG